jgi:hippurate hydrolase
MTRGVGVTGVVGVLHHGDGGFDRGAECEASDAPRPPEFTTLGSYPPTDNDRAATARKVWASRARFGDDVHEGKPAAASDLSVFDRSWNAPCVFLVRGRHRSAGACGCQEGGGAQRDPGQPFAALRAGARATRKVGLQAMVAAASAWLCAPVAVAGEGRRGLSGWIRPAVASVDRVAALAR